MIWPFNLGILQAMEPSLNRGVTDLVPRQQPAPRPAPVLQLAPAPAPVVQRPKFAPAPVLQLKPPRPIATKPEKIERRRITDVDLPQVAPERKTLPPQLPETTLVQPDSFISTEGISYTPLPPANQMIIDTLFA